MGHLTCDGCGRVGNEEDGIELGGECIEEDCDGTIIANPPFRGELIDAAIDDYAVRAGSAGSGAAPYNSESLAQIYAPRVRQLFELQHQGFKYAEWKWNGAENRWHGVEV